MEYVQTFLGTMNSFVTQLTVIFFDELLGSSVEYNKSRREGLPVLLTTSLAASSPVPGMFNLLRLFK